MSPEASPEKRVRAAALAALRSGRVTVLVAEPNWDPVAQTWSAPVRVYATVASTVPTRAPWVVRQITGRWECGCADGSDTGACRHIAAVRMVTGHPG